MLKLFLLFLISFLFHFAKGQTIHPRLYFSQQEISVLQEKAKSPEGIAIINQLKKQLIEEPDPINVASYAAGYGLLYTITGDNKYALIAAKWVDTVINDKIKFISEESKYIENGDTIFNLWESDFKAIYRAPYILGMALTYDLCYNAWSSTYRIKVAKELEEKTKKIINGGGVGWNSYPWSNWQGTTKGAGGVAALALEGDEGVLTDMSDYVKKCRNMMLLRLSYMGDKGWTHEGFDYLRYELNSGTLPFLQAFKFVKNEDLTDSATNAKWFLPFFVMQSIHRNNTLYEPMYGLGGSRWNTNRWRSGDFVMGMGITPQKYLPAVLWTFNSVFGLEGDKTFNIYKPGDAIFALLNYPISLKPENPEKVLSKIWEDKKAGYYIFRNQWKDKDDFVTVINTNELVQRASHSYKDAGSIRVLALGVNWIDRGVRNKGSRNEIPENIVLVENATNSMPAKVIAYTASEIPNLKASITLDMTSVYSGGNRSDKQFVGVTKAIRAFAFEYINDSSAIYALLDSIAGGGKKTWQFYTPEQNVKINENGFTIVASNGSILNAVFVIPEKVNIEFNNGKITATGGDVFYVVFTVSRVIHPNIEKSESDINALISIDNRTLKFNGNQILIKND